MRVIPHPRAPILDAPGAALDAYQARREEAVAIWAALTLARRRAMRVLHVGCGHGFSTAILGFAVPEVTGLAADEEVAARAQAAYGRHGVSFRRASLPRTHEPNGGADAVVCTSLLERLPDPRPLLEEAERVLAPGGVLLVATPNRLTTSPGRTRPVVAGHAWEYTPGELGNLLRRRYAGVRLAGLVHGRRLRALEAVLGVPLQIHLRRLPDPDRAWWLRAALHRLGSAGFRVRDGDLAHCLEILATAEV